MGIREKAQLLIKKYTDLANNELLVKLIDGVSRFFPDTGINEAVIRKADREAALAGATGETFAHEPGLVGGQLNRKKILIGTTIFYHNDNISEADIKLLSEGGFDFLITEDCGEFANRLLSACEKYSIAVIGHEPSLSCGSAIASANLDDEALFSSYVKSAALVGDMGWDEANAAVFPLLGSYHKKYAAALPGQFLFNNLFPAGATKKQTGCSSYREYVDSYSRLVGTDYISTDIYPFHPLAAMHLFSLPMCLNTYHCVADACRCDGKDFWLYIQTQGRWFSHIYRLPTYEQIKWQLYAALGYGARALIHVAYTPVWGDDAYAMTDKNGNLTEQYIYAKRANAELQRLSEVLQSYRSLGVVPSRAEKENPQFLTAMLMQKKNNKKQGFDGIYAVCSVVSESSALTGFFKHETQDKYAILLTDCSDLTNPYTTQKLKITFAYPVRVKIYEHGVLAKQGKTKGKLILTAGTGDGIFIEFEKI